MKSCSIVLAERRIRRLPQRLACISALLAIGCSQSEPYEVVPVTGTVRYDDGSLIPAAQITLTFDPVVTPIDEKTHPRDAVGYVNVQDGTIDRVTTYKFGDGVTSGKSRLMVVATDANNQLLVPKQFTSAKATPLEVDTADMPLDIRVPKP